MAVLVDHLYSARRVPSDQLLKVGSRFLVAHPLAFRTTNQPTLYKKGPYVSPVVNQQQRRAEAAKLREGPVEDTKE